MKEIAEKKYNIFVQSTWSLEELRNKVNAASAKQADEDKKNGKTTEPLKGEVTLPSKQTAEMHGAVMNVHVPAPIVHYGPVEFSWHAFWHWLQPFLIGASAYAAAQAWLPAVLAVWRGY